jgi:hypothetical protein
MTWRAPAEVTVDLATVLRRDSQHDLNERSAAQCLSVLPKGDRYLRFDGDGDRVDAGYPKAMTSGWSGAWAAARAKTLMMVITATTATPITLARRTGGRT